MAADATIVSQSQVDKKAFAENQIQSFAVDANFRRDKEFTVYMYNTGARQHRVSNGLIKNALIPGCPKGQRYIKAFSLGSPVQQSWQDADTGQLRTYGEDARRVMMDLINPANMGINQDFELPADEVVSQGANLAVWGLFWSLNDPPTEEEIDKATKRMEKNYRALLQQADNLARAGKHAEIQEIHHLAADYFDYKGAWNVRIEAPGTCPNCGANIKPGVAYHRTEDGIVCVIDWNRTIAAGVKKEKDRPTAAVEHVI